MLSVRLNVIVGATAVVVDADNFDDDGDDS